MTNPMLEHAAEFLLQYDKRKHAQITKHEAEKGIEEAERVMNDVTQKLQGMTSGRQIICFGERAVEITDKKIDVIMVQDGTKALLKPEVLRDTPHGLKV